MFGREFVLQWWRNSYRKKKCSCLLFCCLSLPLGFVVLSSLFVNEIPVILPIKKKKDLVVASYFKIVLC